jgi:hypothetical protein
VRRGRDVFGFETTAGVTTALCGRAGVGAGSAGDNAGQAEASFRFVDLLDLPILMHGDAQMFEAVALALIGHVHETGHADPAADPSRRWTLLHLRKRL